MPHREPTLTSRMEGSSSRPSGPPRSTDRPRCPACQDVIGVYEPLVHVLDRVARRTSRAAEPTVLSQPGRCYHLVCYLRLSDEPPLEV